MNYQVYKRIVINERYSDQIRNLLFYAANLYTNCDDDTSKMF